MYLKPFVEVDAVHRKWRPVVGFEGYYLVSNDGQVKSAINGKVLKLVDSHGYKFANLRKDGKTKSIAVHRLVCMAFNGMPENDNMQVDHLNMVRSDNRPENLEWVTPKENQRRKARSKKAIRGVAEDGSIVIFPTLLAADMHGFDASIINRVIPKGLPYNGFIWEVIS